MSGNISVIRIHVLAAVLLIPVTEAFAQIPNPTQTNIAQSSGGDQPIAVFHVDVVSRTMKSVNYHHREGSTHIDFRGTALAPDAKGEASVDSKTGATKVNAHFSRLEPAAAFGPEFVTYVLWAVTPEGRPVNLGEVFLDGTNSSIQTSTDLQAFGMFVTAEPYFAVTQPSDVVVMENFIREDTTGTIEQVDAKFELLKRGTYTRNMPAITAGKLKLDKRIPLDLQEARNAYAIAVNAGAGKYAADTLEKARVDLENAEGYLAGRGDKKALQTVARQATQMAEDARIIEFRKEQQEEEAAVRDREARATQEAAEQTHQREIADAERMRAEADKAAAEAASRKAESDRAAADAARAAALEQQQKLAAETASARAAADEANRMRMQAEKDKEALREQIRNQLNMVLETRESARGLIVNMSDVLFDTAKYTLKPGAREKLAKVSGILLAHPGLILAIEGHTDSVGGDEYNQELSEHRAEAVRDYLVTQGIAPDSVSAKGFGKTMPVATNDTPEGRQQNRRVELVVSGDPISTQLMSGTSNIR
jgi:outer membrane protein OmpA-like peptidoglycan-associated protein